MHSVRVIPRIDIKGSNLVKGIHLEGLRVLGRPEKFAYQYYIDGADELIYMDTVASLYDRNSLLNMIEKLSNRIFIPLTVGGGLRTLDDIRAALQAGADKVAINTAAIHDPEFVRNASKKFGSSTIVVAVEVLKGSDGRYYAFTENGRENSFREVMEWTKTVSDLGAGEILLTSIDREGTGKGYDIPLVKMVAEAVPIPVIAHGGAGEKNHVLQAIRDGASDAVCMASILHYDYLCKSPDIDEDHRNDVGNLNFIKSGRAFTKIVPTGICDIKAHLDASGVDVRTCFDEKGVCL